MSAYELRFLMLFDNNKDKSFQSLWTALLAREYATILNASALRCHPIMYGASFLYNRQKRMLESQEMIRKIMFKEMTQQH